MKENDLKEVKVSLGKILHGTEYFFCIAEQEVGVRGCCGKDCPYYVPRNGKSGICESYGYVDKPIKDYILNVNGEIKEK